MRFTNTFRVSLRALRRNTMRSILTALGIIIGVAAVITMVSIGNGAKSMVEAQVAALGQNLITVMPGSFSSGGMRSGFGFSTTLVPEDFEAIANDVENIDGASPEVRDSQQVLANGLNWRTNVNGSLNLIEATLAAGVKHFVFSSTCATYGDQDGVTLDEDTPQMPINAYGGSKRAIEMMLRDFERSDGLQSVIFRYFNVAGADPDGDVGEQHIPETHLIPLMLDAIDGKRAALTVFGSDYPTPDGTCIRDYVHVCDLVDAHVLGMRWLQAGTVQAVMQPVNFSCFS